MLPEKMKEVLSEEDQKKLEASIAELVEQKAEERATLKVEQKEKELKTTYDADYAKKLDEAVAAEKVKLEEQKNTEMKDLESSLLEKLSSFLDLQISEKISEETLEKIAINETYKPIIEGIKNLFEEKFIDLDSDGSSLIREAKEEIESLNDKLSSEIGEKIDLKDELDRAKADLVIANKTRDLSEAQAEKVKSFFSDKTLVETEKKIDAFMEMILEKEDAEDKSEKSKDLKENTDITTGGDGVVEESPEVILEKKNAPEKDPTVESANRLM